MDKKSCLKDKMIGIEGQIRAIGNLIIEVRTSLPDCYNVYFSEENVYKETEKLMIKPLTELEEKLKKEHDEILKEYKSL